MGLISLSKNVKKVLSDVEILKEEEQIIECYKKYSGKGLKILFGLYKNDYKNLLISAFFFILKQLPVWIVPIVTAD